MSVVRTLLLLALALLAGRGEAQSCLPEVQLRVINLARGRPAFQSSSYEGRLPSSAVDGICDGNFGRGSCIHTNLELEPWWYVDLGDRLSITSVVVKNRADCCWDRLQGAQVHVGNYTGRSSKHNPLCGPITDTSSGSLSTIYCNGLVGRYLSIVIHGRADYLHVCEVEVFGSWPKEQC